jgi:hypothetical protein
MFMPIFAYFAVVAPALLGLLCLAEAVMDPPGPMPLASSATGLPVAYVAPKTAPVLTVREGIVAEVPKGSDSYALSSTSSIPAAAPAKPMKAKVAKASKKKAPQQEFAQFGWQQNNQPFGGGWQQQQRNGWEQPQQKRPSRNASNRDGPGGRYAMSGQQSFFSPFGTIR